MIFAYFFNLFMYLRCNFNLFVILPFKKIYISIYILVYFFPFLHFFLVLHIFLSLKNVIQYNNNFIVIFHWLIYKFKICYNSQYSEERLSHSKTILFWQNVLFWSLKINVSFFSTFNSYSNFKIFPQNDWNWSGFQFKNDM